MNFGTVAYALVAGASIGIGVLFLIVSIRRHGPRPVELSVGCFGILAGAQTIATLGMQKADDVAEYGAIMKGSFTYTSLAALSAAVWVVATTTRVGWPRVPAMLTVTAVGLGIVSYLSNGGLIVESVTNLRDVSLFGEPFVVHVANTSSWRFLLDGFLLALTIYFIAALVLNFRRDAVKQPALLVGIAIIYLFSLYDSLVDEAVVNTPYLAPFGLIAFALGPAIQQAKQVTETEHALSQHAANLEELVSARTDSLHAANTRVLDELSRQEQTVGNLTRLTRQSIALDNLGVDRTGNIQHGIGDVVAAFADIIGASSVNLELNESAASELADLRIDRQASNVPESAWQEGAEELEYPLRTGDLVLGRLIVRASPGQTLSKVQQRLANLSAELLTAALRRFRLEEALVVTVVDDERHRIARDLHDSLMQRLYAAAFHADALLSGGDQDPQLTATQTRTIRELVLSSMAEMRSLLFELQPETFDVTSLTGLIEQLCDSTGEIYGRPIACRSQPGPTIPPQPKLALYRIAQEALGNALRHAEAQNVSVSVDVSDEAVCLAVTDDGVGFDANDLTVGQGLRNVAERAKQVGATIEISSEGGSGTTISAIWLRVQHVEPDIDLTYSSLIERTV